MSTCTVNSILCYFMFGTVYISHDLSGVVLYLLWLVWVRARLWQYFSYVLAVTIYRKLQELGVKEMCVHQLHVHSNSSPL